jgi:lambda repressor-like predicted transcriptional regulator
MNNTQISNLLRYKTGKTVKAFAADHGYVKQTFYRAICGRLGKSPIYQIISDATGKPKAELWPNKFEEQDHA